MKTLLLEIGSEEIPAGYIGPALEALSGNLLKKLDDARVDHGAAKVYGTPCRLAVSVADVADRQESVTEEVVGPPEKVGFDDKGNPTVAAEKFAEKLGIPVASIRVKETPKGRYLCAEKTEDGVDTASLLKEVLPSVISATPFPKTMKWKDYDFYFARPVHSVLALLGEAVVSFKIEDIQSDRQVFGHRFMKPGKIRLDRPEEYEETLRSAHVIADFKKRREEVAAEIAKAAEKAGGKVLDDPELLDIVTNLVEYPAPVAGRFDDEFLELPDEVLITAMREHQKYFAVVDDAGKLKSSFIAVNNTVARDMDLVARGHERVIRARLADAQFFYRGDLKESGDARLEKLKGVLFQAKLGTMYEKVMRIRDVAAFIADAVDGGELGKDVDRTAVLAKTDLVSEMVGEFPKLQGIMGRVYAAVSGEADPVAMGIEEHYRPTHSGGKLPDTLTGAVVAIADKIDSICGCFSVGLIPTGASDPYALRRQGIGIVQIMLDKGFTFSLKALIRKSASLFGTDRVDKTVDEVYEFLKSRMVNLLSEEGYAKDVIQAVLEVSVDHVPDAWNRVKALESLKKDADFEPLAAAFKRVVNILRKAGHEGKADADEGLFEHESEKTLLAACRRIQRKTAEDMAKGEFEQALRDIAGIRTQVDAFFDDVMVMVDDAKIRENRLSLLSQVAALFEDFADFSKIST
jgi:glycyl-tRNA synthetase beta chain